MFSNVFWLFSGAWKASVSVIFWNKFGSFLGHFWYLGSCMPQEVSRYPRDCCRMAYLRLSGPNMDPSWFQVGSSWVQVGPKLVPCWLKLVACWAQVGSKLVQVEPKLVQIRSCRAQEALPDVPGTVPGTSWGSPGPKRCSGRLQECKRDLQNLPKAPKISLKKHQN